MPSRGCGQDSIVSARTFCARCCRSGHRSRRRRSRSAFSLPRPHSPPARVSPPCRSRYVPTPSMTGPSTASPVPVRRSGVRRFQARAGLVADGIVGPQTRRALGALGPPPGRQPPAERRRDRGWDVAALQFALETHGFPLRHASTAASARRRPTRSAACRPSPASPPTASSARRRSPRSPGPRCPPRPAPPDQRSGRRPLRPARRPLPRRPGLPGRHGHRGHRRRLRPRGLRRLRRRLGPHDRARPRQRGPHPLRPPLSHAGHPGRLRERRHRRSAASAPLATPPARTCTSRSRCEVPTPPRRSRKGAAGVGDAAGSGARGR